MNTMAQFILGTIAGFVLATIAQQKPAPPEPPAPVPAAIPVKDWKWERKGPLDQPARRL